MTPPRPGQPLLIELVRNEPACRKCRETKAVLEAVEKERPGKVSLRIRTLDEAQADGYGLLLTPTVLIGGHVLCAGIVPRRDGILRIVDQELGRGQG